MTAADLTAHISRFPDVASSENFGYRFFFHSTDRMTPFATLAESDNEYDAVSHLDREGIFRINIGVARDTFKALFPDATATWDHTALNVLMPHPHYAAQHFLCVLNPEGEVLARTLELLEEAHGLAKARFERKHRIADT